MRKLAKMRLHYSQPKEKRKGEKDRGKKDRKGGERGEERKKHNEKRQDPPELEKGNEAMLI